MVILISIVAVLAVICLIMFFRTPSGKSTAKSISSTAGLSPVAKALVAEFNALPRQYRPFDDIVSVVRELDAKHAADAVERDNHFNYHYYDLVTESDNDINRNIGYRFTWGKGVKYNNCYHVSRDYRSCKFSDYGDLHYAILEVKESITEKERTVLHSQYSHTSDTVRLLEERLRAEAGLNQTFVKEFKELT